MKNAPVASGLAELTCPGGLRLPHRLRWARGRAGRRPRETN
ncbi:hypothetical protein ACFWWB_15015 [Streptomyces sp. NPDC058690]